MLSDSSMSRFTQPLTCEHCLRASQLIGSLSGNVQLIPLIGHMLALRESVVFQMTGERI